MTQESVIPVTAPVRSAAPAAAGSTDSSVVNAAEPEGRAAVCVRKPVDVKDATAPAEFKTKYD